MGKAYYKKGKAMRDGIKKATLSRLKARGYTVLKGRLREAIGLF